MSKLRIRDLLTPLFVQAEIYVMYHGDNNNRSSISKEVIERNIHTMKNIPIVGNYDYDKKNFKGHDISIDISEDGNLKFVHETTPLGVIPENFRWRWETVYDKFNVPREYLIVENAYIWNRDVDLTKDLFENTYGQSMEIGVQHSYIREDGIKEITDFYFEALCILGIDKNGEGQVTPAFENARMEVFEEAETYSDKLSKMLSDFEQFTNNKGGLNLDKEVLDEVIEKDEIVEETVVEEVDNTKEVGAVDEDSTHEEVITDEADKVEEVNEKETIVDIPESFEDETATEEVEKDEELVEVEEVEVEDEVVEETEETEEVEETAEFNLENYVTLEVHEAKIAELQNEINKLQDENKALNFEKHERACNDVIADFKERYELDEASLATLNFSEIEDVKELESKLYEIIGRNVQFNKSKDTKDVSNKIIYSLEQKTENSSFGFEKLFRRK